MRYTALAFPLLALPAAAGTHATPAALATFLVSACIEGTSLNADAVAAAGFTASGDGSDYTSDDGLTLDIAARDGFMSCELVVPSVTEDGLGATALELAAAIGEAFDEAKTGSVEDGMLWTIPRGDTLVTEAALRLSETGDMIFTAATSEGEAMEQDSN